MNSKVPLVPQEQSRMAFRGKFGDRSMKPSIVTKDGGLRLEEPPFVTVPGWFDGNLCHFGRFRSHAAAIDAKE